MGLLSFRGKNKKRGNMKDSLPKLTFKNDTPPDKVTDSGISSDYHSTIADSFMMASTISDITFSSVF
jgi:hypothetical protein